MNSKEISQVIEESDFLRRVKTLRGRSEEEVLLEKLNLRNAEFEAEPKEQEKLLYLSATYSLVFLWTLLFVNPSFSLIAAAFTYPIFSANNSSEGWRWMGYFIVGLSSLMQIASFF